MSAQWIRVEDALPETKSRIVLGYFNRFLDGMKTQKVVCMRDDHWQFCTHWMPLPEPPDQPEGR